MTATTTNRLILLGLLVLMTATRSHHFASVTHLPDASWAVFFLAGFYLQGWRSFAGLLGLAALSDYVAIQWFGVSAYCISPAYPMLIPAYGSLWLAGRWYARHHQFRWSTLLPLAAAVVMGAALCEVLSGGSFYMLAGRSADVSMPGYAAQFAQFFPASLQGMILYLGLAALIHAVIATTRHPHSQAAIR
jgi:hypothetical protein